MRESKKGKCESVCVCVRESESRLTHLCPPGMWLKICGSSSLLVSEQRLSALHRHPCGPPFLISRPSVPQLHTHTHAPTIPSCVPALLPLPTTSGLAVCSPERESQGRREKEKNEMWTEGGRKPRIDGKCARIDLQPLLLNYNEKCHDGITGNVPLLLRALWICRPFISSFFLFLFCLSGKDFHVMSASKRTESGVGGENRVSRGRVAELMKTFSVSNDSTCSQPPSRSNKPPIPNKPNHLQHLPYNSFR